MTTKPAARIAQDPTELFWRYTYAQADGPQYENGDQGYVYLHAGRFLSQPHAEQAARDAGFRIVATMAELIPL